MKFCLHCKHGFSSECQVCPSCGHQPERLHGLEAHAPAFAHGGRGFNPEYFLELSKWEEAHFWFRNRKALVLWALRTYKPACRTFLEVGCGTGFVLSGIAHAYPEMASSGSDISLIALSHAMKRVPSAHLMQMDARQVPFLNEFDAIGAFDVPEHIEEDKMVLVQLQRALKPDGVLLLTVPQHPRLWSVPDTYVCHVRRYTHAQIKKKIVESGLTLLRSTSFVTFLLPIMALSRALQKRKLFHHADELKINRILNSFFNGFMLLERLGIQFGMNYPVGGSRLIVAKKQPSET